MQVRKLLDAGANVGLGVDGSASNDTGNMIGDVRQALLLARCRGDADGEYPRFSRKQCMSIVYM